MCCGDDSTGRVVYGDWFGKYTWFDGEEEDSLEDQGIRHLRSIRLVKQKTVEGEEILGHFRSKGRLLMRPKD